MHYWRIFINFAFGMTKNELVARLRDKELDDFEVKAAKSDLPKNLIRPVLMVLYSLVVGLYLYNYQ